MPDPQTPTTIQITLANLFTLLGLMFSLITLLVGYLWTLTVERLKKVESRLDDGSTTINKMRVEIAERKSDVDHIVISMRDHYESSDDYRHETDRELSTVKSSIESIKTRCIEREKAGKP